MGKFIDAATWIEKKLRQAHEHWNSKPFQDTVHSWRSKTQRVFHPPPTDTEPPSVTKFTWLPRSKAARIILALILVATFIQAPRHSGIYAVAFGFFFLAVVRYGWFCIVRTPQPKPSRRWWRTPGAAATASCVLLFIFVRPSNHPEPPRLDAPKLSAPEPNAPKSNAPKRNTPSPDGTSYSATDFSSSSNNRDARLLSSIEEELRQEARRTNNSPASGSGQRQSSGCNKCNGAGTIRTGSNHLIVCPVCRGGSTPTAPGAFPKY